MATSDLFDDEEYRMIGEALQMATPLPPGQDWDYFNDATGELGDTENPAVDAVFNWGSPNIGHGVDDRLPPVGWDSTEDAEICDRQPEVSGGNRHRSLVAQLRARGARNPEGLAAWIGRRNYGAQRFAQMAARGRR